MEHVFIREATLYEIQDILPRFLATTIDGELFDSDVLAHKSTFVLTAFDRTGVLAFLPVQQPLMLENLIFRPGLTNRERAVSMTRMTEHAVEEAEKRDAGELYFLCREPSTLHFADRHLFTPLPENLVVRRLNLLETFGA